MPSVLQSTIAAALGTIRKLSGVPVVYSDGVFTANIAAAGVGLTEYQLDDGGEIVETWTARDYLIATSDIVLNGVPTLPKKGHTIVETINGVPVTHTVLAPAGKQVYSFSDSGETQLRVHTQETAR
jgi:hypothetical protein